MAINNTLKDIREERNLIQADLAEAIGSCSQTIGRIERGERNPSPAHNHTIFSVPVLPAKFFCIFPVLLTLTNRGVKQQGQEVRIHFRKIPI